MGLQRGVQPRELGVVDAVLPADLAGRAKGDDPSSRGGHRQGDKADCASGRHRTGRKLQPRTRTLVGRPSRPGSTQSRLQRATRRRHQPARDPRNGRNFEYLSEDPLVSATLPAESINGIQAETVISTIKHYSLNCNETNGHWLDAIIDLDAHRESVLLAFEIAIERSQPGSVMTATTRSTATTRVATAS